MEELDSEDFSQLPRDFYLNIQAYVQSLKDKLASNSPITSELADEEIKVVKRMVSLLFYLRLNKLVRWILEGSVTQPPRLLEEELKAYEKLNSDVKEYLSMSDMFASFDKGVFAKKILVRFIRNVPAFVGVDLKTYGPFKPEDVANLPMVNADALAERGLVEKLEEMKNEVS